METYKPVVAIALGDAAGVGPEVVAKALLDERVRSAFRPLLVGNQWVIEQAFATIGQALPVRRIEDPGGARFSPSEVDLLATDNLEPSRVVVGEPRAATGAESAETLCIAAKVVAAGKADAVVSAPISKTATALGGWGLGHVEIAGEAIGAKGPFASMLTSPRLRVMNMTGHCSVVEACHRVTKENVLAALELAHRSFAAWGTPRVRIAVCALNPHNGENGNFGREEIEHLAPAVAEARRRGIDARGPFPVDTIFARALEGEFDLVLALYHDQGFAPIKTVALHDTASVGLGMPIPYATTDHGTGFDIAGRGVANPGSLIQAINFVVEVCTARHANRQP